MDTDDTAPATLSEMLRGYWITQIIYVVAKLGIADLLEGGPRMSDELAISTGTHAPSLYRLLRALATIGVFEQDEKGSFSLTAISRCLVSNIPGSMRARAIANGEEWYRAWGDLLYSVKTGQKAFDYVFGMPFFQYLAQNTPASEIFNETMTGSSEQGAAAIIAAYDFSWAKTIVDVGGGHGALIASILNANPHAHGILFDVPQVTEGARAHLVAAGLAERCEVVGGDFFQAVPSGGDIYLLSWIIHDWDDERSVTILKNCYQAMASGARLLLIERVVPHDNEPSLSKLYDLHMLVLLGSRERTKPQYQALLDAAGFKLTTIIPIPQVSERSLIEGMRV
ncbi:MAG: hypothetical protein JO123_02820 [Ktedonobacteraceae bacterium]|nr:hypothetical protein [Ktedonobacteraceae bacterium]